MTQNQIRSMKELLRIIAYPRRGTHEPLIDIQWAADRIQEEFSLDQLEEEEDPR